MVLYGDIAHGMWARAMPGARRLRPSPSGSRSDESGVVLVLQGELDLASAPQVEQELRKIEATTSDRILIDLRGPRFIDSTGISLMIQAQDSAHANGHRLALRRGPNQVQQLFRLTGLLDHFAFED
jgi:anti-anti-sigma factor